MVVVIDLILGSFAERFGDVTVEIKILHLVAQVPEVKVSLQLLDSNETLRQLRMVIGVPRGTLGCGLLDQSAYLLLVLADPPLAMVREYFTWSGVKVPFPRWVISIWKRAR